MDQITIGMFSTYQFYETVILSLQHKCFHQPYSQSVSSISMHQLEQQLSKDFHFTEDQAILKTIITQFHNLKPQCITVKHREQNYMICTRTKYIQIPETNQNELREVIYTQKISENFKNFIFLTQAINPKQNKHIEISGYKFKFGDFEIFIGYGKNLNLKGVMLINIVYMPFAAVENERFRLQFDQIFIEVIEMIFEEDFSIFMNKNRAEFLNICKNQSHQSINQEIIPFLIQFLQPNSKFKLEPDVQTQNNMEIE